ncbi:uncharacterized protein C1orf50 homolog [Chelonus insularis]|uniref:uncharacterized protein C1orf50 homolog n=1 Tax=Chelonus insularis TaxID=460826 RepID=UPI00158D5996|nr:uncharacterized protein C1orf50 homolog [Chelonus insularis]
MKRIYTMDFSNSHSTVPNKIQLLETKNPIEISPITLTPTKAPAEDLLALATEIQKADTFVKANAINKLQIITENIRFLQKQTERILFEAKENAILHHAACNFIKHPGHIYHLYEKQSGEYYFSMLSPEEWGENSPPQIFKGSYRLECDQSWTPVSQIESKDAELSFLNKSILRSPVLALNPSDSMNIS